MLPMEIKNPLFGLYLYPQAKIFMENQQDISWSAQEIPVEDDKHDYLSVMSIPQRRLTDTTLQLFVEIEQRVGEVWNEFASWFPHSEEKEPPTRSRRSMRDYWPRWTNAHYPSCPTVAK